MSLILLRRKKAPVFDPAKIGTLAGWYKADTLNLGNNAPVSSWADSNGSSNTPFATDTGTAVLQTNQQNGLPTVYFNGASSLVRPGMTFNGFCVGIVFKFASPNGMLLMGDDNVNQTFANPNTFMAGYGSTNAFGIAHNNVYAQGSALLTTKYYSYIVNCDSNGVMTSFVNGASDTSIITSSGSGTCVKLRLAFRVDNNQYGVVSIGEAVIYKTGLITSNVASLNTYLFNKWAIY